MIYFVHIIKWIKKFITFPVQSFCLLINDLKKDYFQTLNSKFKLVIIIGLPKSGTTFIEEVMSQLGYVDIRVSPLRIFDSKKMYKNMYEHHTVSEEIFKLVPKKKYSFIKVHSHFEDKLLEIIKKYNLKVIISKRSLVGALISRYCHILSDKNHRHFNEISKLEPNEGFKKSLIFETKSGTTLRPIDYFYNWLKDWEYQISLKKLDFLVLDYENLKDKKKYIQSIISYLGIKNYNLEKILKNIDKNHNKLKRNNLEKNFQSFLKPKTYNKDSLKIKNRLNMEEISEFVKKNIV